MDKDIFEQILNMLREDVKREEVEHKEMTLEEYYRVTGKDAKKRKVRIVVLEGNNAHTISYIGTGERVVNALAAFIDSVAKDAHVPAGVILDDLAMRLGEE